MSPIPHTTRYAPGRVGVLGSHLIENRFRFDGVPCASQPTSWPSGSHITLRIHALQTTEIVLITKFCFELTSSGHNIVFVRQCVFVCTTHPPPTRPVPSRAGQFQCALPICARWCAHKRVRCEDLWANFFSEVYNERRAHGRTSARVHRHASSYVHAPATTSGRSCRHAPNRTCMHAHANSSVIGAEHCQPAGWGVGGKGVGVRIKWDATNYYYVTHHVRRMCAEHTRDCAHTRDCPFRCACVRVVRALQV